jgi:5S rRNA maturation endonuclease (ribonuclease M5)
MYNTENLLTFENLFKKVEPYQIFAYYLGKDLRLNQTIPSPLRKDTKPSFSLHLSKSGYLYYNDWATGDWGGAVQFVQKFLNLTDMYQALSQINYDMNLGFLDDRFSGSHFKKHSGYNTNFTQDEIEKIAAKSSVEIKIKQKEWSDEDLLYWKQFGISKEILQYFNVFPCEKVFLNKIVPYVRPKSIFKPAYAYVYYKDGNYSYKIYQPLSPESKWMSNTDISVLQGWDQLPQTGKVLIITKSQKDVMTLYNLGIPAVATQGELMSIKPHVYEQLKARFEHIYLLFDFDYGGVKGTQKLRKLIPELQFFFIQTLSDRSNGYKDISDYRKDHTDQQTLEHLRKCLINWNKQLKN